MTLNKEEIKLINGFLTNEIKRDDILRMCMKHADYAEIVSNLDNAIEINQIFLNY